MYRISFVGFFMLVIFAIACGMAAKNKGYDSVIWTVLGFLFGILALIAIGIIKPKGEFSFDEANYDFPMGDGTNNPLPDYLGTSITHSSTTNESLLLGSESASKSN